MPPGRQITADTAAAAQEASWRDACLDAVSESYRAPLMLEITEVLNEFMQLHGRFIQLPG